MAVRVPTRTAWAVVQNGIVLARFRYGSDALLWMEANCPPEGARVVNEDIEAAEEQRREEASE